MADPIDTAQAEEEIFLNSALSKRVKSLAYTGFCHWCDEPLSVKAHFCDKDCRDDYEKNKHLNGF